MMFALLAVALPAAIAIAVSNDARYRALPSPHDFAFYTHDVGVSEILVPVGDQAVNTVLTPQVKVRNFGTVAETVKTRVKIYRGGPMIYQDSATIVVGPGYESFVSMPHNWTATDLGRYNTIANSELGRDQNHANDTARGTFDVIQPVYRDVGVQAITAPSGILDSAEAIAPGAEIRNFGDVAETFWVYARIDNPPPPDVAVYIDSVRVINLGQDATVSVTFRNWLPPRLLGACTIRCSASVARDQNRSNDTLKRWFTVIRREGWSLKASIPRGPKVKPVKDGGALCAAFDGTHSDGVVYAFKGNNTTEFYAYDPAGNAWQTMEDIPLIGRSGRRRGVKKGAALTGRGFQVFAVKGNSTSDFFQFDPLASGGSARWTAKASLPGIIKEGAGLAAVGDDINVTHVYLMRGSGTRDFYRYGTTADSWETRTSLPLGPSGKGYKTGSGLACDESRRIIFALKGTYNEFYAYSLDNNAWSTRSSLPLIGRDGRKRKVKDGGGLVCAGGKVFALKGGNTRDFWCYDPDANRWTQLEDVPIGSGKRVKNGGALTFAPDQADGGGSISGMKGNSTNEFFSYPLPPYSLVAGFPGASRNALETGTTATRPAVTATPNPARSLCRVRYSVPRAGPVRIALYDMAGARVSTVLEDQCESGNNAAVIDASHLARGIYVLTVEGAGQLTAQKLVLE